MSDQLSRRDAIKILGVAGAAAALPGAVPASAATTAPVALDADFRAEILPLTSTSEVFIPPRGRSYNTFSFDFPEPSVEFDGFRFGFIVFTDENAYALDLATRKRQSARLRRGSGKSAATSNGTPRSRWPSRSRR